MKYENSVELQIFNTKSKKYSQLDEILKIFLKDNLQFDVVNHIHIYFDNTNNILHCNSSPFNFQDNFFVGIKFSIKIDYDDILNFDDTYKNIKKEVEIDNFINICLN